MTERASRGEQIPAVVAPFQLEDVRLYEVKAERLAPGIEAPAELPLKVFLYSGDSDDSPERFRQLLTFETTLGSEGDDACNIYLAIEGMFVAMVDIDIIKPEVIERFRESDAILLLWPYLRQMFHDLTVRMRLGVAPLPIVDPRALIQLEEIAEPEEPAPLF